MVIIVARLKAAAGHEAEVEKQLKMLVEYVRNEEPGTLSYIFLRAVGDPTQFTFYERYIDQAALEKHSSSARFLQIFGKVTSLLEFPPSIEMYEEVAGKR